MKKFSSSPWFASSHFHCRCVVNRIMAFCELLLVSLSLSLSRCSFRSSINQFGDNGKSKSIDCKLRTKCALVAQLVCCCSEEEKKERKRNDGNSVSVYRFKVLVNVNIEKKPLDNICRLKCYNLLWEKAMQRL